MAAPCGMRTRSNRPLRRLTRDREITRQNSSHPSTSCTVCTSPDSFFRLVTRFLAVSTVFPYTTLFRSSFSIFYRVEDDAVATVRYWCWRSSEAQRPECVKSGGKCDGRPVRDAYTVQPAAAPPDQTRCHEGPRFISTVPRQEPPHLT